MEKSIKTIWKDGFLDSNSIVVPKLNNLYNQKSIHIIDKILRMGKINLMYVGALVLAFLLVPILFGALNLGIQLFLLMLPQLLLGLKHGKLIAKIDKNVDSYQYIKSFNNHLEHSISEFVLLNRFFYPLLFLVLIIQGRFTGDGEALISYIIANNPDTYLVLGVPIILILGVVFITVLLAVFGGLLYKLDVNIVYGRVLRKLKEIIADMEELRR